MNFKFYLAITSLFIVLSYNAFSQFNADFSTYTPINGCSPLNVVFKDQSTGTITSRKWIFGNGNQTSSGNQTMPSAIYGIPGAYTVTLIVSDGTNYDTIIKPAFITVYNDPVADFTNSTALSGCNPLNIGLLDNSTSLDGAITIWNWDFGDGQTSTDHLPTHTYVDYGTFPVTLTVFDEHGCNDTKIIENYVNISQTPVPDFVASDTSQCFTPFNVSFTNLSTSAGNLTFSWNFGEGTTSTLTSPSNTFNSFGSYDITLFASDENGCSDTIIKNDYITILDATADFNTSKSIYCIDEDVTFDNTSVGCTSYLWNFGDGVTDTAKNPVHSYATWGDYNVKLISFIENSVCSDTIIKTITVERIEAAFTLDPARYCELPVTVNFTDQSINAVSWEWDLGYTITNNIPALERIITNAQNPSIIYKHTGFDTIPFYFYRDITLTATSAHGCSGTITVDSSLIVTIPNINIYPKKSGGCIPKDFFISDSSTYNSSFDFVTSRIWTLHDGSSNTSQNFTINYTNEGNYNECYKLTTSLGCIYYDTVKIEVGTPQNPNFSVNTDTSCASIGVEFINNSYNEYLIDTVSWVFRSNNDSIVVDNLWSPIVFFNDSGYFTGNLTINYNGCDTTISKDSVVYIKGPYAEFYKTFNCINQNEYSFHTNIIDADNWMWDFKDGFFDSTTVSPNHTFTSSGDYLVSINLSNIDNQCTFETNDDSVHWVRARNLKADYITNFVHGCPGISINFDPALSIDEEDFGYPNPNYNYHKYLWYYDDGSTFYSTQEYQFTDTFVTHTFTEKGIYHTSLIVEDINGCRDTTYKTITIYLPQPDFSTAFESGCKPFNVSYNNTTPYDTTITAWHWNFGNGDTSNIQNPTTTYDEYGVYDVMLSATNILGCTGYNTKFGFISVQTASPSFTVIDSTLCSSDSVFFINTTPGENQNYLWNFGDGNTSTDANPVYFYTDSGTYNVSLKVIDTVGCDTTFVKYDYIKKQSNPIANFVADTLNADCYPLIVSFSDNSGSPYSSAWNWDFGDNATSTLSSPIHAFSRPGQFDVKMIVSTSFGCTDSIIKTEYIIVKGPYADFSFISPVVCKETPVAFYIDTLLDVDQFSWDFGDGVVVPGTGDTIYHTYSDYGFLYPQLIYSDSSNTCPQFARDSITINLVNSGFTISDSLLCSGSSLNFINSSFGDIFYDWDFGDGIHSGIENPTHSYSGPGNYTVYLTVSDQYACSDIDSLPVTVHPLPNYLALNDSIKCDHDTIILNAGVGFASYLWSNNSTLQTLEIAHQGQYTVKVQNAEGCWSAKDTIFVTDIPTPLVDFGNDTLICEGTTITLSAPWSSFHSYNWSNSSTFVAITASPLDTYSVTVTNECGISSDTIFVDMIPLPTVNLGVDTAICTGTSLTLFATGSQYDSYLWNDNSTADSLIADTIKTYFVKVSNSCAEANDSISIDLIPIPALTFVDDTLCEGTTITVFAPFSIYHNYLWNTGVTIDSITAFPDSTYWLNVTSDCGTAADTIFIEKIPLPVVNLGVDTAICNGTSLTLFATGSQYDSYLWNDSTTLDSLVADTIKTYSVTVTNSCSTANDSLNLDLIPIPALTFVDDTLCEGTTITVFAPFSIYHNYLWNTGDTIDSITAFPDSLYSVTVSNACDTSSASIFIEKIPLPVVNLGVDTAICTGTNLTLFATGSQYDSYLWNNGSTADTLVADTINTYSVIVSNVCDTASSSISIDLIPIPNVSFVDDTICEGTTITLNVPFSIYHQYLWNTGDTIDSITAFPDSLYYVKISNACGIDSDSIFIEKIPLPVVNLGVDTAICNGTSLTIFATGSQYDSYLWNDGSTLDSLIADTIYTYSVTVSNVCDTANGSKTIDLIPIPNLTFIDDTLCEGTTITIFAPFSIYHNYLWNIGDTIDSITAFPDSTYWLNVTSDCGSANDTIFIEKIPLPVVNLGVDTAICTGTSLTLFATGSQYDSYLWNDSTKLDTLIADSINTYSVTVTNSCFDVIDSVIIDLIPIPDVFLGNDTLICEGTTLLLKADSSIYNTYIWNNDSASISQQTDTISYFAITVTNICGTSTDSINIGLKPNPVINFGNDTTFCENSNITINWIAGYTDYYWDNILALQSITVSVTDTLSLMVRDSVGCFSNVDTIIVTAVYPATANLGIDTTICIGDSLLLTANAGYDSYSWNNGTTNDSLFISQTGTYILEVKNTCNTASDTLNLIVYEIQIELGLDTILCPSETITLDAGSGFTSYKWNDESTNQTLTVNSTGTYFVEVSNICIGVSDTVDVFYLPNSVNLGSDTAICEGNIISFSTPDIFDTLTWHNGFNYPVFTTSKPGTYYLTAENKCGTFSDTIILVVKPIPSVELGPDIAVSFETETLDAGDDATTYLWSTGDSTQTIQVTPGNYAVWVEVDKDGCKASDTIRILYSPYDSGCIFGVPNAFTPNGDNKNDVLHVRGYCIEQMEFMVFNRFGEMVFKSEDINTGWDGKYKGRLQESEVYIWYLKVKLTDGQVVEKTGNVALLN